ncbi:MAG TPA: hypothetical protein DD670_20880 [Planctomycetaceae bacterium]|nr:hypothetical protein [Planctomycetaceae bacterium]
MTKMATVHAQQMWEYMSITRKTEDFLVNELNEAGKLGWELVNVSHHKDLKSVGGTYCWTAVLKRPLIPQLQPKPSDLGAIVTVGSESFPSIEHPTSEEDASIFEIRRDEPEE